MTDAEARPFGVGILGVVLTVIASAVLTQAGRSERSLMLTLGGGILAVALIALVAAGVALGLRLAADK